jgi:hypothetical protein
MYRVNVLIDQDDDQDEFDCRCVSMIDPDQEVITFLDTHTDNTAIWEDGLGYVVSPEVFNKFIDQFPDVVVQTDSEI